MIPHSAIGKAHGGHFSAEQMVKTLISDHETVARRLRDAVEWRRVSAMQRQQTC